MKICPSCRTQYDDEKQFCRRCGVALQPAGTAPDAFPARLAWWRQRLEQDPDNPELIREYAAELISWERLAEARKALTEALGRHPEHLGLRETLAALCHRLGDDPGLVEQLRLLLAQQPDRSPWLRQLAAAYQRMGRLREAAATLERLTTLAPADLELWEQRRRLLLELGDGPELAAVCREILRRQPDHPQANLYLGLAVHQEAQAGRQEAWAEAEAYLARALAQADRLAPAEWRQGRLYWVHARLQLPEPPAAAIKEALDWLNQQQELRRDQASKALLAEANYRFGEAYAAAGQGPQALAYWRQAVSLEGRPAWRQRLAAGLRQQGQELYEAGKYAAARQVLAAGLQQQPDNLQLRELYDSASARLRRRRWLASGAVLGVLLSVGLGGAFYYYGQGQLELQVNPEARITLKRGSRVVASQDGRRLATPLLRAGRYQVVVEKAGFAPVSQEVQVPWGRRTDQLSFSLKPLYGALQVASQPPGAQVKVRNQYQEKSGLTPTALTELYAVPTTIEVTLPGYLPYKAEKTLEPDQVLDLGTVEFVGSLKVDSEPSGAEVYLDREKKGTTPLTLSKLPARRSRLEIRQPGVGLYLTEVAINPGQTLDLGRISLAQRGAIQVAAKPAGARVFVDDQFVGEAPVVHSLPAGDHHLRLEHLGYEPFATRVQIKPGELLDLKTVSLAPVKLQLGREPTAPTPPIQVVPETLPSGQAATLLEEGRALFKAQKFAEARTRLEAAVRADPTNARAYYLLGWTYNQLKLFDDAVAAFKAAINLQPRFALAHDGLGWTYNQLGRYAEAREACQQALRLEPNYPEAHLNLGRAYLGLGERDRTLQQYQTLSRLKPEMAQLLLGDIRQQHPDWLGDRPTPWPPRAAGLTTDPQEVIRNYLRRVQDKDVAGALEMYAAAKQPVIKRQVLEAVAKDTEYYRIDRTTVLMNDGERAKVEVYLYHKKYRKPEEYWLNTFELVQEAGTWKIWATPGKRLY